ncbi:MAG: hypothetical protein Q6L68_02805 [Thermostichus sp. DG02_5_bins_236]
MTREQQEELERIHRALLWNNLKQRVEHAQSDPTLLALLAREALELGFALPASSGQSMLDPRAEPPRGSTGHHRAQ